MLRKTVLGIMFALSLINVLNFPINIQQAKATWTGTVYIRADGSIDPPDAPIVTYDNITYTLKDSIASSGHGIVVERNNIVIDGAGYTVLGSWTFPEPVVSCGVYLSPLRRNNVTVKNVIIKNFSIGIYLFDAFKNSIVGNNITDNGGGISLNDAFKNSIVGNNITARWRGGTGIYMVGCSFGNSVSRNNIINHKRGIMIGGYHNSISGNNIINNGDGILITYSGHPGNNVSGNNIINNFKGIVLDATSNDVISGNNVINNKFGICLYSSPSNNTFYHNNFLDNNRQVYAESAHTNVWDDGYPSGGNHWSDYTGVDEKSGPNQDQPGSDGIGDTPYIIDANNTDRYPLMNPWVPTPPVQTWLFDSDFQYNLDDNYGTVEGTGHLSGKATLSAGTISIKGQITLIGPLPSAVPEVYLIATDGLDKEHARQRIDLAGFSYQQTGANTYSFSAQIRNVIQPINDGHYEVSALITYQAAKYEFFVNTASRISSHYFPLTTLPAPPPPPPNQPPTCVVKLQKNGVEICGVDVGEFFDIYVGDSTDDTGIVQVRFSSDDEQDGIPTGEWTDWYSWDISSGDWDANAKIKKWAFATPGKKEVWAEVKDDIGQTSVSFRDIRATVNGKSAEFSAGDRVIIRKYNLLYKEPRLDSTSIFIYEDKCGQIIENESNGIFADGHFWWYVKVEIFEYWVLEDAIVKNQAPIPSLKYAPKYPKANKEVIFDASESRDPDGKIEFYEWYLDGEFKGRTENPIIFYAFEKEGTFSLKVKVTDNCWESASEEVTIKVEGRTRPEKIRKIISKDDLIKIADDLGISHYTEYYGLWRQREYFELNGKTYSQEELLGVLNKPIKKINETGEVESFEDVIYGMVIRNILEDAKLVDLTSRSTWAPKKEDFKNLIKTNTWAETILTLAKWEAPLLKQLLIRLAFLLEMPALHVAGELIGPILKIAEGYRVYKTLEFLEDVLYKRALWIYMQERIGGTDSVNAFGSSPVPMDYVIEGKGEVTRKLWEDLYETYKPFIIPEVGGLGENFEKIKAELRKRIYDVMESYSLMPKQFVKMGSVGELRVYDSEGRVTGIVNGEIREEIPYSMYDEETETIIIFPSIGSYHYEILGIDEGTYSLNIAFVEYANTTTFTATDIPTKFNVIHQYAIDWTALSFGEEGVTIMVDSDGDGVFEHTFTSDSELTYDEFLSETVSWEYVFEDPVRHAILKISTDDGMFQFITPSKDYGIRKATLMYEGYVTLYHNGGYVKLPAVILKHSDGDLRIEAYAGTGTPFCYARALDYKTGKRYMLIVNPP